MQKYRKREKRVKAIFFSDFDGTVTKKDVIESIMSYFAPPHWKNIHNSLIRGKLDIDVGIRMMFNLIPCDSKEEIIKWCLENVELREGFGEFLQYLNSKGVHFVILSGGLDFYIYPLLHRYLNLIHKIHCNRFRCYNGKMDLFFTYRCNCKCRRNCGTCKLYVIQKYYKNYSLKFYAGDGITDLDACQYNDIIFSTGGLTGYLKKYKNKRTRHFETFYDVINAMEEMERESYYEKSL
ncbi:MtnX-like HAD-IB family phosphatase [Persephonella atlantica]|uniref:MtnX-like HAD-IB family phosphatase n=1 Tax=Persephonella atlantica TaxID=2699429 RepID=A0ABS1GGK7_9AQUI|nr:MtnX-like HAD-IB family phosphatase [Persephonella atlantica]MBK3332056.1 MtnX-like HAD-IB family phosphatase [Persephonella atlantica]